MKNPTPRQSAALPYVRAWLFIVAFLVFAMVIVGGATRLTDSGLSITEWQPLLGAIPPLTDADWLAAFDKYKLIPEYSVINRGMTLAEFKFIYWWEWAHRFLGRIIGAVFLLPLLFFALTKRLPKGAWPRLAAIFVLGGLQGALGWYMVRSGLAGRVDVSQYRLAAHLTLAAVIFAAVVWAALRIGSEPRRITERERGAALLCALIILQIAAGGFVAGLDAGKGYNTWPLMEGALVPGGLFPLTPWWRNLFENAMTAQFSHRVIAYVLAVGVAAHAYLARTPSAVLLLGMVLAQAALGIWTLLAMAPLELSLIHQGGAFLLLAAALWNLHCWLFSKAKKMPATSAGKTRLR